MAKNVINTGNGAMKFIKPKYIVVSEYIENGTADAPGGDDYILEDVIEDTTSVSQDDNETTDIECETSDSPIVSIVKLGKWQFASEIGDLQDALLKSLAGFTEVDGKVCAPSSYIKKYVKVAIVMPDEGKATFTAFVIPRLQLNTKLLIESLNTNLARISLAGTATDAKVGDSTTPFYVEKNYTLPVKE